MDIAKVRCKENGNFELIVNDVLIDKEIKINFTEVRNLLGDTTYKEIIEGSNSYLLQTEWCGDLNISVIAKGLDIEDYYYLDFYIDPETTKLKRINILTNIFGISDVIDITNNPLLSKILYY